MIEQKIEQFLFEKIKHRIYQNEFEAYDIFYCNTCICYGNLNKNLCVHTHQHFIYHLELYAFTWLY